MPNDTPLQAARKRLPQAEQNVIVAMANFIATYAAANGIPPAMVDKPKLLAQAIRDNTNAFEAEVAHVHAH